MNARAADLIPEEADVLRRVGGLPVDLVAMTVVANVCRAAQEVRARQERAVLRPRELTWSGFSVLFTLWVWGPAETHAVAASVGVSKSTLTGVLDTLERRGLVTRAAEADRRRRRVALTGAGRRAIEELFPRFNQGEAALVSGLSADEQATLARLLRRVIRAAREEDE